MQFDIILIFIFVTPTSGSKKTLIWFLSESVLPMFSPQSFIVSGLIFRSLIHFEFIFMYGFRDCSNFIFSHVAIQFTWRRQWHPTPVLLPGKSHGWRSLEGCSPWGRWGSDMTERLHFHFSLSCTGEGNGNPLQCSSLENPRDGGASCAAVYGITQSQTQLKQLSSSSSSMDILVFPHSSVGKEDTCNAGDPGSVPRLGRCPGAGKGYPPSILAWRIPWTV